MDGKAGKTVEIKDFSKRKGEKRKPITLRPKKYVLIEGFMLFKDKKVVDFLDKKIYLELSEEKIIERRKIRFEQDHLNDYDAKVAIPEFLKRGVTQKKDADYVIDADKPQAEVTKEVRAIIESPCCN